MNVNSKLKSSILCLYTSHMRDLDLTAYMPIVTMINISGKPTTKPGDLNRTEPETVELPNALLSPSCVEACKLDVETTLENSFRFVGCGWEAFE
jgi:hypothetical protein